MNTVQIALLGKFSIDINGCLINKIESKKAEELLIYLLVHQERPHHRDRIADILWDELASAQSKNYLRKTLWQLQTFLKQHALEYLLLVDEDWLQINSDFDFLLDILEIQRSFELSQGKQGAELNESQFVRLNHAVYIYRGDLLEGWYQDWCLYARERLQYQYLEIIEKLMDYCEEKHLYENGLRYGETILRYDRAREHTHRHLMRLYYLSGDRTTALRQYMNCAQALREELNVEPDHQTQLLYESIQGDNLRDIISFDQPLPPKMAKGMDETLDVILRNMGDFQKTLNTMQTQLAKNMEFVRRVLKS